MPAAARAEMPDFSRDFAPRARAVLYVGHRRWPRVRAFCGNSCATILLASFTRIALIRRTRGQRMDRRRFLHWGSTAGLAALSARAARAQREPIPHTHLLFHETPAGAAAAVPAFELDETTIADL